jgi:hypothetical protein
MASEKKPSIYYDRGTIGSSDELDEYGVWVKSEPQDLSSAGAERQEPAGRPATAPAGKEDFPGMDIPDMEDLPDFGAPEEAEGPAEDGGEGDGDLELPDIDFDGDTFGAGEDAMAEEPEAEGEDNTGLEESLTDADVSGDAGDADSFEFSELPEPDFSDFTGSEGDGEESGETAPGSEAEALGFVEVPFDTEDAGDEGDTGDVGVIQDEKAAGSPGGEDAKALEDAAPRAASPDLSTQLLIKIADELASIRTELSTLKSELAGIKTGDGSAETEEAQKHGFFGEEDDEKIALTGDELDNILNTADFTEETGADATEALNDDFDSHQEAEDSSSGPFQEIKEITETPSEGAETEDLSLDDITQDLDLNLEDIDKDLDELGGELSFSQPGKAAEPEEAPVEFDIAMTEGDEDLSIGDSPVDDVSVDDLSIEDSSGDDLSMDGLSLDDSPVEDVSLDDLSIDDSSVGDLSVDELSLDDSSGGDVSLDDLSIEDVSVEDLSMEDLSVDDSSGGDLSVENIQAEDAGDLPEDPLALEDKDSTELRRLREEGAQPMTPPPDPDDASFLEEDPLAFSGFDEESLDLSNAVIDEPDLSGEIEEPPLEEPSLDAISIDLDLEEEIPSGEDGDGEEGIDLTGETESFEEEIDLPVLDETPAGEEPLDGGAAGSEDLALIPEGFVVEADDSRPAGIDEGEEIFAETPDQNLTVDDAVLEEEEKAEEILPPAHEDDGNIPTHLKQELKTVLSYMDQLLESLPDEKIEEFAKSEYFDTYKKLFKELGLV